MEEKIVETVIEVPEVRIVEKIIEVPKIEEKIVEKFVEVPDVRVVEKAVEMAADGGQVVDRSIDVAQVELAGHPNDELASKVAQLDAALMQANSDLARYRDLQALSDRDATSMRSQLEATKSDSDRAQNMLSAATTKVQQLEAQLARARSEAVELRRTSDMKREAAGVNTSGNVEAARERALSGGDGMLGMTKSLAVHLRDLESGDAKCVTVRDIGLDVAGVVPLDGFLQVLSAIMANRADASLGVFGVWLLCHCIYILYLIYAHFT